MGDLAQILSARPDLAERLTRLQAWARNVRSSEYHVTHACNLRCEGCWFFEFGFDLKTAKDVTDLDRWRAFARAERARGVSLAILNGGEPSLFPDRVRVCVDEFPYVWLSTNGLAQIPRDGLENVAISSTVFGGGNLDDKMRGIRPGGGRMTGLFEKALANYCDDERVFFVYALSLDSAPVLERVVERIRNNGNRVLLSYYTPYARRPAMGAAEDASHSRRIQALLEVAVTVAARHPDTVLSHPYYIRTLIQGTSHWAPFGYDVCPSISVDYPGNEARLRNGNPTLPLFNAIAPDLKTVNMCAVSGDCDGCRDSQAVMSWLMVSMKDFTDTPAHFQTWVEISESFWRQFRFSPYFQKTTASTRVPSAAARVQDLARP